MRAVVFAGPTIAGDEVRAALDCVVLPPAGQGDVLRATIRHRPHAIGLIDGVFLGRRAVWHREILAAMTEGVHVFGAASMGALRAAELDAFGMVGVGLVYEAYRDGAFPGFDGVFEDDDEVAVEHAPAELGATALSDAMVDLRATLLAAEAAGMLDRRSRDALTAQVKALPFGQRSFAALEASGGLALRTFRRRQKREDARAMLAAMRAVEAAPFVPHFRMERTEAWSQLLAATERELAPGEDPAAERALDALRLDPAAWHAVALAAEGRRATRRTVDPAGVIDAFRHRRALARRADLDGWMRDAALDAAGFARLLADDPDRPVASPPTRAMADQLRLDGRFGALEKQGGLIAAAVTPTPSATALALDWYFAEHLQMTQPMDLAAFWRPLGWRDAAHFERAVVGLHRSRGTA